MRRSFPSFANRKQRRTARVPGLEHEALDDPVEEVPVVVARPGVGGEILHRFGGPVGPRQWRAQGTAHKSQTSSAILCSRPQLLNVHRIHIWGVISTTRRKCAGVHLHASVHPMNSEVKTLRCFNQFWMRRPRGIDVALRSVKKLKRQQTLNLEV